MMTMLTDWTDSHTNSFQKELMTFGHNLNDTGLFTDAALAALLDAHPSELLDVCTRGSNNHPQFPNKLRTGDFRDCEGKDLIAAAKEGWVWINMRQAMNVHPEYKEQLDAMYGGVMEKTGKKIFNAKGGILITSPIARTPYHFDKTEVILWHIRGQKRLFVYPLEQKYISDQAFEKVLINPINDDLPYLQEFDTSAQIIDVPEGHAITWPLNSPHKVENSSFCVSVTTEYSTRRSAMKNAAMVANGTLREKFGVNKNYSEQSEFGHMTSSAMGVLTKAIRKRSVKKVSKPSDLVSFKIDPNTPGYIVEIEPFERNF